MIRYVKVAERSDGEYRPFMRRGPICYRVGQISEASCLLDHRPPERDCRCGIYCATAHSLAWVPYYDPYDPGCALLLVQPVGRALSDGRVVRAERVLVLGEIEDVRTLLAPRLRRLDQQRLLAFLKAAAWLRIAPKPSERVFQLHCVWRALGRRISRKRCEAFWRAYRAQMPDVGCPYCRRA